MCVHCVHFQAILFVTVRPFSKSLQYRRINRFVAELLWLQLVWLVDWWAGVKVCEYVRRMKFHQSKHISAGKYICVVSFFSPIKPEITSTRGLQVQLHADEETYRSMGKDSFFKKNYRTRACIKCNVIFRRETKCSLMTYLPEEFYR
jgi:hypothetical protein